MITRTLCFLRTISLLILLFPFSAQAVIAIPFPKERLEIEPQFGKSKKEIRKAKRVLTWKKVLKHGPLALALIISLILLLSTGIVGSNLFGFLFFNVAILAAYFTMRLNKKPSMKLSVIISSLTIIINLLAAYYNSRIVD